ncbi:MAG: Oligoendopeptidase F, plasmid [Alphaproteobacteria bacterium MarineAlpha3_Bin4]|nr:M3 family oligoendopeptidase [Pseudomonadota bacterium]PPR72370.1 MAG: Oligoendopeptidase F, plasmid [Alphaproteobacteria bacterium MarineAlpha3_Bin4]
MNDAGDTDPQPELPTWSLDDLYSGQEAPELTADLEWLRAEIANFRTAYEGRLVQLNGAGLAAAIRAFEAISERLGRVLSYVDLLRAGDINDTAIGRFAQTTREQVTDISTEILFFTLELNRIDDDVLERKMADPEAAPYAPWVRDTRVFRNHQLSDDLEKLLHEKIVTGRNAWIRLFNETMSDMCFEVDGKENTLDEILNLLNATEGETRKSAGYALGRGLINNIRTLTLITNTLAKDKEIEDQWRGYPNPVSYRNLANHVEDEVITALVGSVRHSFGELSHRYYRLKARWFGVDQLDWWDRNAPIPGDNDRRYSWNEARELVLDAYRGFAPEISEIAGRFFAESWIDALPRRGKAPGAFSHPTVPSVHPYVLVNHHGHARDVMTLAHELGHGVHQVLAAGQGALMAETPLTLAETASVFGEMLTFRAMLARETDTECRRVLLAGKVEDMINTVVRQVAFHQFETLVHTERVGGELSAERLGDIWVEVQEESLGPALRLDDNYRPFWAYIPHFIHAPFYVYAYAFGDCLVNSLYGVFARGHDGFQQKYLDLLRAGGTLRLRELLAPFSLDASDPEFWKRGLSVISGFIDELEGAS